MFYAQRLTAYFIAFILVGLGSNLSNARATPVDLESIEEPSEPPGTSSPRNSVAVPLMSFVLPGLGQYLEGEPAKGLGYTSFWALGLGIAKNAQDQIRRDAREGDHSFFSKVESDNYYVHGDLPRLFTLGGQFALAAGSFSAYDSFVARSQDHIKNGDFGFIQKQDSLGEILMAPFAFEYFASANTLVPLLAISSLYLLVLNVDIPEIQKDPLSLSDVGFGGSYSYLAGTHEEALFRGFLLPSFVDMTGSSFWGNNITAAAFAIAHLGSNDMPIPQLVLGWHLGNITINSGYSLTEAIFLHTWWDVVAFAMIYQMKIKDPESQLKPILTLPPLEFRF